MQERKDIQTPWFDTMAVTTFASYRMVVGVEIHITDLSRHLGIR